MSRTQVSPATGSMNRWLVAATWLLAIAAVSFSIFEATRLTWVCDDAFISFRYAQNLIRGHGLCFNPELAALEGPVEGYTNFSWTLSIALGMWLGVEPVTFCNALGVACHAGTLLLLLLMGVRRQGVFLPVAAIAYALHHHAAVFATSGLETSLFCFLATAGTVVLIRARRAAAFLVAGLCYILLTMTRPDGGLFYAIGGGIALLATWRRGSLRPLLAYALPFLLCYVPYFVWRYHYYGYPLPNTFYAKSASDPYLRQGIFYLALYFHVYVVTALGIIAALLACLRWRSEGPTVDYGLTSRRAALLVSALAVVYTAYIAWVGGDFMFGRFAVQITPVYCLGLQLLAARMRGWHLQVLLLVAAGLVAMTVGTFTSRDLTTSGFAGQGYLVLGVIVVVGLLRFRYGMLRLLCLVLGLSAASRFGIDEIHHDKHSFEWRIAEERSWYPPTLIEGSRLVGARLREKIAGLDVRVGVGGQQVVFAYYAEFPWVIELHGLTDRHIAHRQVADRGKVGHEKMIRADDPYLKRRRVHFLFSPLLAAHPPVPGDQIGACRRLVFDPGPIPGLPPGWRGEIVILRYDRQLMAALRQRGGFSFEPFEDFLDEYLSRLETKTVATVRADYAAFCDFYFDLNDDADRRRRFEAYLRAK